MGFWNDVHRAFGGALTKYKQPGMLVAGSAVVAEVDGFPLVIRDFKADNANNIELRIRFPAASFDDVERALASSEALASALGKPGALPGKILKKHATIAGDDVRVRFPTLLFWRAKPEKIIAVTRAIVEALKNARVAFPDGCERCHGRERCEGLTLVDGMPFRLGGACLEAQNEAERQLQRAYDAQETRTVFALATGAAVTVAGAVVWGAIGVLTGHIYLVAGVFIGLGVGASMGWAARRPTLFLRALACAMGAASVLGGQVAMVWWMARSEISPLDAVVAYFAYLLELPGDEVFALLTAAFGGALAFTLSKAKNFSTRKERLEVTPSVSG